MVLPKGDRHAHCQPTRPHLWLMAAIVLVGLNLRPSMAAVGPLLNAMRGEIALSFGDVSLLTALPVLTLGLGMFFGLGIARRVGSGVRWPSPCC